MDTLNIVIHPQLTSATNWRELALSLITITCHACKYRLKNEYQYCQECGVALKANELQKKDEEFAKQSRELKERAEKVYNEVMELSTQVKELEKGFEERRKEHEIFKREVAKFERAMRPWKEGDE